MNRNAGANLDQKTVDSFGDEWSRHDQSEVSSEELLELFEGYFKIFPWDKLPQNARGFDMGCGSGRWAKFVAQRVGHLTCIDASPAALTVAKRNLNEQSNVSFIEASVDSERLAVGAFDFGYSLGVLHHIPDTAAALKSCVNLLVPGAPFLVYLYYRFDNRPLWFRLIWKISDALRTIISELPPTIKSLTTDVLALTIYFPLARLAKLVEMIGLPARNLPLYAYRDKSFYTMRTDSRDRFGTGLEQRFTRVEIQKMMEDAGLENVVFSEDIPFHCAVGTKRYAA